MDGGLIAAFAGAAIALAVGIFFAFKERNKRK